MTLTSCQCRFLSLLLFLCLRPVRAVSCPQRCSSDTTSSAHQSGARIVYLIVVHNNRTLHDAVPLFQGIRDPRNIILIHVDAKAKHLLHEPNVLQKEIQECSCQSRVRVESMYDVEWSRWSMNLPTLWAMRTAVEDYANEWDVFINLSGDTMAVYTVDRMAEILQELPYNFVTSSSCETGLVPSSVYIFPKWWHKRAHYTNSDTEKDPSFKYRKSDGTTVTTTVETYFGSQWMILQADFCQWIVQELKRKDSLPSLFRHHLITSEKLMSDETYFSSLLMNSEMFNTTLPLVDDNDFLIWRNGSSSAISDVRYERMDEHVPTAFGFYPTKQRYEVPKSSSTSIEATRPWGPYFLGVYDLAAIRATGALFVRKVSKWIDPNIVEMLPVEDASQIPPIRWPMEVAISEKPDWEAKKAKLVARLRSSKPTVDEEDEEL